MPDRPLSDEAEFERVWGPIPTRDQLAEAHEWNEQQQREDISQVLENCYTADNVAFLLGVRSDEIWRRMAEGEMVGLKFDTYHWVPKWQFDETEEGELVVNPKVLEAKKVWGNLDEFGFCCMMQLGQETLGMSRVEILKGTDESAIDCVMAEMITHGVNLS